MNVPTLWIMGDTRSEGIANCPDGYEITGHQVIDSASGNRVWEAQLGRSENRPLPGGGGAGRPPPADDPSRQPPGVTETIAAKGGHLLSSGTVLIGAVIFAILGAGTVYYYYKQR